MPLPGWFLDTGHLDTGTTPVFSMSGPQGPPTVHVPVQPDPLQGAGDPWLSFHGVGGQSDGSFLSSGTYQTGQSTGQSAAPSGAPSTPATGVTFGMPPGFLDAQSGPGGGPGVPVMPTQDPIMMQVLRQQMLLTQSMVDFLSRTAQGAGAVPPLPGAQGPVPQAQVQGSQGQGSERLTMDTKWIPAAPMPDWKGWNTRAKELSGFKAWLDKFASWLCPVSGTRWVCCRAQGSFELAVPCGDCESRSSHSKSQIVSFATAELFWILQG